MRPPVFAAPTAAEGPVEVLGGDVGADVLPFADCGKCRRTGARSHPVAALASALALGRAG